MNRKIIRNVMFDLGGVLIGLDVARTVRELEALGIRMDGEAGQVEFMSLLMDLETGRMEARDFLDTLSGFSTRPFTAGQFEQAWGSIFTGFDMDAIQFIRKLKGRYRLLLLSNTNALHVPVFERLLKEQSGIPGMHQLFDKVYYSHLLRMRKPDREIYKHVIRDSGIDPAETLFIDDLKENTDAARELGFRVHQLKEGEKVEEVLTTYVMA